MLRSALQKLPPTPACPSEGKQGGGGGSWFLKGHCWDWGCSVCKSGRGGVRLSHSYLKCHGVLNGSAKSAPRPLHRSEPVCGGCGKPYVPWVEQDCCWIALAWAHIGCTYRAGLAPELPLSTPSPTNITSLNYNRGWVCFPLPPP